MHAAIYQFNRFGEFSLNLIVVNNLQRAGQYIPDLFGEVFPVRFTVFGALDATVLKVVHLLGKFAALFQQAR